MDPAGAVVPVKLPETPYDVAVRPGLLAAVGALLAEKVKARKAAVVTDSAVGPLHLGALRRGLSEAGFESIIATIPAGENHKTLQDLLPCYDAFLSARI